MTDASDNLVNGGQVYSFSLPSSLRDSCGAAYTPVTYTTTPGSGPAAEFAQPQPSTSASVRPPRQLPSPPDRRARRARPPAPARRLLGDLFGDRFWSSGYQLAFTVTNTGTVTSPLDSWTVRFSFAERQSIANSWNAAAQSGQEVTANSESYNGASRWAATPGAWWSTAATRCCRG